MAIEPKRTFAAGGVVINPHGLVLVVNQNNNSWSLPKGHIDEGEDPVAAARREIAEESGVLQLELVRKLGTYERFQISKDGRGENPEELKNITMYLFTTDQIDLKPADPDNPEARWVEQTEAALLLTHPKDREFFIQQQAQLG